MRLLAISLCMAMAAPGLQQQTAEPLPLHDPPRYKEGQIELGTDSGAHASAGMASRSSASLPVKRGSGHVETKLRGDIAAQPGSFAPNLALGSFLLEAQRTKEAIPLLERAAQLQPGNFEVRHNLAVALMEEGRLPEAEALLRQLQSKGPLPAVIHLEARWLAASGKPVEAAAKFQQAAESEPNEKHLFDWGNHMLAYGAAEPAGRIFEYAASKYPESARLKVAQGVSFYARGEYDRAVELICAGIRIEPEDLRPLAFLGQMIGVAPQREREIRAELERFARIQPDHAPAQYYYGLSLLTLGDGKSAERQFRKAAALDPQMPQPRLELGKLLADKGMNEAAVRELEAAVRLAPDFSGAQYRLAQLYQRTGEKALAERHFAAYRKARAEETARQERERQRRSSLTVHK